MSPISGGAEPRPAKQALSGWIRSPTRLLLVGALLCVLAGWGAAQLALATPWLGLGVGVDADGAVRVDRAQGPGSDVPEGARLLGVRGEGERIELQAGDLLEEPDVIDDYAESDEFFARQAALFAVLQAPQVHVEYTLDDAPPRSVTIVPARRPLTSLPGLFWYQLAAGAVGLLVSLWVLVLRPRDRAVQLFTVLGATLLVAAWSAAIYGARAIAMDAGLFAALSVVNHAGTMFFGSALLAFFLIFPRRLVAWRGVALAFLAGVVWLGSDRLRLMPDQNWGLRVPMLGEMLLAIAFALLQWRKTSRDPRDRAALRWLGASTLLGTSLFVVTTAGSGLFGAIPSIPQSYAFGFFLLMHAGLALGLRRHRLFELNEWAYVVLFWVLAALAVLLLDTLLVLLVGMGKVASSSLALLVCGLLYLPARSWLWGRFVARRTLEDHELFRSVLEVSFATDDSERTRLWRALLERLFQPLETVAHEGARAVTLTDEGLALTIPAIGQLGALRLARPWGGKGLFAVRHLRLAEHLVVLMQQAEDRRDAFERGAREERLRIAGELHDDLGARLLSGLYEEEPDALRATVRLAIADMRAIVAELSGRTLPLSTLLAELRHESVGRLEAAKLAVIWTADGALETAGSSAAAGMPQHEVVLGYQFVRNLTSMVREILSNVLRHAQASTVRVDVRREGGRLQLRFADDGRGLADDASDRGNGMANLERRAAVLGGEVEIAAGEGGGTRVRVCVPLPGLESSTAEVRV